MTASSRWQLSTLAGCSLAIGRYPLFRYDARGGGASTVAQEGDSPNVSLDFPSSQVQIPDLNWRTTRFLGLPLPPGLAIAIDPQRLEGQLDRSSGAVQLDFEAHFRFRIGSAATAIYEAPELIVRTQLSTTAVRGERHQAQGQPLSADGEARLVGVARINPCGEAWLDRFLGLPDEALAVLHCRFSRLP